MAFSEVRMVLIISMYSEPYLNFELVVMFR